MRNSRKRIALLDEIRGLAIFCMVFYHAFVLCYELTGAPWAFDTFKFFEPFQPFFAAGFIFISGICSRLSRSNMARGLKLLAVALALTFISAVLLPSFGFERTEIYFGILHLLACSILLFAIFQKAFDKTPAILGSLLCATLAFVTRDISFGKIGLWDNLVFRLPYEWYTIDWLFPVGIHSHSFFSADYFPLLPWSLIFFFGSFVGISVKNGKLPSFAYKTHFNFFEKLGQKSLLIYIVHIPIIYIFVFAFQWLSSQF
ncbi:MAG: DUF1624 domain-containing protein [Clostridia bacterium]|nr:DUF1624 domain-containing protein [Clostridia bacterium]